MPYIKIWIHAVWSTKYRRHFLTKDIRQTVFDHIKENAKKKNIHLDFINGYNDHVHCLISMNATQNIGKIVQLIKGESSYWINKNKLLCEERFEWQTEYFAVSVDKSNINTIRNYIKNQEEHHRKKSFNEEYSKLLNEFECNI